jgi:hypothetical protein
VTENQRQQRMVERIQEDERLPGDLPDDAATALVEWASRRAAAAAADPQRPDAAVEAEVQMIRAAARAAARAGEQDVPRLLALAEAELTQRVAPAPLPGTPTGAGVPDGADAPAGESQAVEPAGSEPAAIAPAPATTQAQQPRSRWARLASFLSRIQGGRR